MNRNIWGECLSIIAKLLSICRTPSRRASTSSQTAYRQQRFRLPVTLRDFPGDYILESGRKVARLQGLTALRRAEKDAQPETCCSNALRRSTLPSNRWVNRLWPVSSTVAGCRNSHMPSPLAEQCRGIFGTARPFRYSFLLHSYGEGAAGNRANRGISGTAHCECVGSGGGPACGPAAATCPSAILTATTAAKQCA